MACDIELPVPAVLIWKEDQLSILDQTRLPHETVYRQAQTPEVVWQAIKDLAVRGAPAIGIAAAYGLCLGARGLDKKSSADALSALREVADYLNSARPTAVNLAWALNRLMAVAQKHCQSGQSELPGSLYQRLCDEAIAVHQEDIALCRLIGTHGERLISEGAGVLTHCNAGALATGGIGTATAAMYEAQRQGRQFTVYADETRPLLQGGRLTAWELSRAGIDVRLLCDNMAASVMAAGKIDVVIVGTDRVAANGDVANKIGTLGVAIFANDDGIPFYVACPYSTFDMQTPSGAEIEIEQRGAEEVLAIGGHRFAADVEVCNPAFDVTPSALVSGFITEQGIIYPPFEESLSQWDTDNGAGD